MRKDCAGWRENAMDSAVLSLLENTLRSEHPQTGSTQWQVCENADRIAADPALLSVEDAAEGFSRSPRSLQRLFRTYVGVSPKWVIQRYRLHEAAEQLKNGGNIGQAALALSLGYTDQAHFVRDFKATVGTSPAAYARARLLN